MIKYDYTGAAALWDRFYNLCFNPWDLDNQQRQRREFLRDITRGNKQETIDFLWDRICFVAVPPILEDTHKIINNLDNLLTDIINFKGVKND